MRRLFIFLLLIAVPTLSVCAANQFVEAGAPAPDREWYGLEYQKMAELLASGMIRFPALDSSDGRKVFERMVSVENFSFARSRTLPIEQRLSNSMQLQESANAIMKLYANKANEGAALHDRARLHQFLNETAKAQLQNILDELSKPAPPAAG